MDFSYTEEQEAVRELTGQILADHTSHERSKALETSGTFYDDELWQELVKANLPSIALPESVGGSALGILELCVVMEEVGRHVAPVPLLPTLISGLALAEFGTPAQQERWLGPVANGGSVLSHAFQENAAFDITRPRVTARKEGDGWRLDGEKICVPAAQLADVLLVSARTGEGQVGVFLLEPGASGIKTERTPATNLEPLARLTFSSAEVAPDGVLGDPHDGAKILEWIRERVYLALASQQIGVAEEAMRRTAEYVIDRKQFGRQIGSFQSAQHRLADAYIDVECMRSVVMEAAWRMSEGLDCSAHVGAAKWWGCMAGDRVTHSAQHLHGGTGADVEYPIHRYFLWSQQGLITLGGPHQQAADLGARLVRDYQPEA